VWRHLLRCRECGQLYFYEFFEWIDWEGGNDPQYTTYIPVESDTEIEALKKASSFELLKYFLRLQRDWPMEAPALGRRAAQLHPRGSAGAWRGQSLGLGRAVSHHRGAPPDDGTGLLLSWLPPA
jgi:hypothetical protein